MGKDNRRHEGKRTETFQNIFVIPVSQVDATDIHTVVNIVEIQCNAWGAPLVVERETEVDVQMMDGGKEIIVPAVIGCYGRNQTVLVP